MVAADELREIICSRIKPVQSLPVLGLLGPSSEGCLQSHQAPRKALKCRLHFAQGKVYEGVSSAQFKIDLNVKNTEFPLYKIILMFYL